MTTDMFPTSGTIQVIQFLLATSARGLAPSRGSALFQFCTVAERAQPSLGAIDNLVAKKEYKGGANTMSARFFCYVFERLLRLPLKV